MLPKKHTSNKQKYQLILACPQKIPANLMLPKKHTRTLERLKIATVLSILNASKLLFYKYDFFNIY